VRCAVSFVLSGGAETADVLVLPHACDSLQGFGSLLLDFLKPRQPVLPLYLPRGGRASDLDFLTAELRALAGRLAVATGRSPSPDEGRAAVLADEAADALLARLHRERARLPLGDEALYRVIRSREYLPAERFSALASEVLASPLPTGAGSGAAARRGVPLLLSGIVPEPWALFGAIADAGGVVAADDLAACGRRLYPAGTSADPFRRMAERFEGGPPDPTRGSPIAARLAFLRALAASSGARGVVFYTVKFCEPELFDRPLLRKGLQAAGLPSVELEVDIGDPLSHQAVTRLEAFVEMAGQPAEPAATGARA
jgi:hypothetical protein